jgi:ribonuclease P protein component
MERIRRTGEYRRVYDNGTKLHGRRLLLFVAGSDGPGLRVGVTVSGKVGGACVRNKAKRRIREALKLELTEKADKAPLDMVFVAKGSIKDATFEEIQKDIRTLLNKAAR